MYRLMHNERSPDDADPCSRIVEYRPPRIAMLLLALAAAVHWLAPATPYFSSLYAAMFAGLAGFGVMMWAWWQFRQSELAICPTQPTASLITDGIYRFTRNPMYLGMLTMLIGVAIFFGTLPFYLAALVFFLIIDRQFCRFEEQKLVAAFGSKYQDYRSSVRRWV